MAGFGKPIEALAGEPLEVDREVTGLPPGGVIAWALLQIRTGASHNGSVTAAVQVTPTPGAGGLVLDAGAGGVGRVRFIVPATGVAARALVQGSNPNAAVSYVAVSPGYAGNSLSVSYLDPGGPNVPLSVTVSGGAVAVILATNGFGTIFSTATQVASALAADAGASSLFAVQAVGSGAGVCTPTAAPVLLSGGSAGISDLAVGGTFAYEITVALQGGQEKVIEVGTIKVESQLDAAPETAGSSRARASETGSARVDTIINQYIDSLLVDFRQLRVWDEHARRSGSDPSQLLLTYGNLNPSFLPQVFDGANRPVPSNQIEVDYDAGAVRVAGDSGYDDYFVTYDFDLFPAGDLAAMLNLTLQELNLAGAADGGYITDYRTVDGTPTYWDAPLALGVVAKCFRRLAVNTGLWRNYLIWQDGTAGQGYAQQAGDYFQAQLDDLKRSLKRLHLIGQATSSFDLFRSIGFGFFAAGAGGKFRELRVNKLIQY